MRLDVGCEPNDYLCWDLEPFGSFWKTVERGVIIGFSKLDVGCGHNPTGDINIDLYVEATPHRSRNQTVCDDTPLDLNSIPNFVKADACHLPFRLATFDEVFSCSVIEHVREPFLMLKEVVRVASRLGKIRILCPHKYGSKKNMTLHLSMFNQSWFERAFHNLGIHNIGGAVTAWRNIPHDFMPLLRLPATIEINAKKG